MGGETHLYFTINSFQFNYFYEKAVDNFNYSVSGPHYNYLKNEEKYFVKLWKIGINYIRILVIDHNKFSNILFIIIYFTTC